MGDNFSVHDTKVIAGGVCIPHTRLISREIMRVTIPSCVNTVKIDGEDYVAVYAATPYGVTNHLHVPIHKRGGVSKAEKETIAAEVKKQITDAKIDDKIKTVVHNQVKELKFTPRDIVVSPFSSEATKLKLQALCLEKQSPELCYFLKPNADVPAMKYSLETKALIGKEAQFGVAVNANGKFWGEVVAIGEESRLAEQGAIPATDIEDHIEAIAAQLKRAIGLDKFKDKKNTDAKLVFFVRLGGKNDCCVWTQLPEPLSIEVTLPCECCSQEGSTTSSDSSAAAGESTEAAAEGASTSQQTSDAGCNCSTASTLEWAYR